MAIISPEDYIQAAVAFGGREIATISGSGYASVADVLKAVRHAVGALAGTIIITMRNATRGWRQERALFLRPMAAGVQLSLF